MQGGDAMSKEPKKHNAVTILWEVIGIGALIYFAAKLCGFV